MFKNIDNNIKKVIIIILIIVLILLSYIFFKRVNLNKNKNRYSNQIVEFYDENKNPIFEINKIVLYSSSTAVDKSKEQTLKSVDVHQFTDIAIYINNKKSMQTVEEKNTIKEIYIDDIQVLKKNLTGNEVINYKNSFDFGKFKDLENNDGKVNFDVILKNEQNENEKYSSPVFYTDCSNPITLGYINKNIITNYNVTDKNVSLSLDGTILKNANYDLKELDTIFKFKVHIKNNLNEDFVANVSIDNSLESEDGGIYTGYLINILNVSNNFLKLPKEQ